MDDASYFRALLVTAGILIFLVCLGIYIAAFRKMVAPERLFGGGVLCYMLYIMDALRAAIEVDLTFAWRLLPLALGQLLFIAWLLEPAKARRLRQEESWIKRRGRRA